jgi:hypothetical protein
VGIFNGFLNYFGILFLEKEIKNSAMKSKHNEYPLFFLCIKRLFSLVQKPISLAVMTIVFTGCMASAPTSTTNTAHSDSVTGMPTHSEKSNPLKSNPRALNHLVSSYIKNPAASVPYCLVYGNPKTARVVLVMWTALTCPLCSRLHQGPLLTLKTLANKRGDFALILRDYPTDPISLRGSAMVWSLGKKPVADIMHRLMIHDWMHPVSKALDALEILTLKSATSPEERAKIRSAKTEEKQHKAVFYSRSSDQEALGLTQVPWAIILEKQGQPVSADLTNKQKNHSPKPTLFSDHLQKTPLQNLPVLAKGDASDRADILKTGDSVQPHWTMHVLGTPNMDVDRIVTQYLLKHG